MFLAASFSSLSLSSLISLFMGEKAGRFSLLLEVTELHLASRCVRISSSLFRPSRSKTLQNDPRMSSVCSLSRDFIGALGLMGRPEAILFYVRDAPASSCFLLAVVTELVDSAYDRVTYCEFVRCVEVALPCVVALTTCCFTHSPSIAGQPLVVGGTAILFRSCFKLGLLTHHLGEIDVDWSSHLLLSKPLRRI